MNFFKKYTTPFGYIADGNKIDAYGVDHSGFSTRDEVEYQFARQERESQLANNLNQQGFKPENYPKLGTSFWGNNPENNYGFGSSNIHDNIENRNNNSFENTFDSLGQEQSKINQSQHIENMNQFSTALPSRYNMNDLIDKLRQYQENALNMDNSSINKVSILNSDDIKRLNLNANSVLFPQQNSFSSSSRPYQLAQNSLPNSASDVGNISTGNFSDDELIEMMYPIMQDHENTKPFPYYDTRWNITVGVGNNINNEKDFYGTNWSADNMPANKQNIDSCLENLEKEKNRIQKERILSGQNPNEHNYKADYFQKFCNIRIDEDTMYKMYYDHMKDDLKNLRTLIPNFDKLSLNKKLVLMDYMYNLGPNKFSEKKFPNFIKGARTNNLDLMLKHDHRLGIDEGRNIWTDKTLRKDLLNKK